MFKFAATESLAMRPGRKVLSSRPVRLITDGYHIPHKSMRRNLKPSQATGNTEHQIRHLTFSEECNPHPTLLSVTIGDLPTQRTNQGDL